MALTNIELYEALKKDLSEESARMIAEVVPKAQDLATKGDIAEVKSFIDSRLLRMTFAFFVPMWASMAALIGILIART